MTGEFDALHHGLRQLVARQGQLLQHSLRGQNQQQRQFQTLAQSLHNSLRHDGRSSARTQNASTMTKNFAQRTARQWNRSLSQVIVDLGKQWQRFGRDGEVNIARLGKSLWQLVQMLQHQNSRMNFSATLGQGNAFSGVLHQGITRTISQGIGSVLGGVFHQGGMVSEQSSQTPLPTSLFQHAQRMHQGGRLALGIGAAEYPAILQRGETVLPAHSAAATTAMAAPTKVEVNIHQASSTPQVTQRTRSDGQLQIDIVFDQFENQISQRMIRGDGLATVLENRYGLSPAPHR